MTRKAIEEFLEASKQSQKLEINEEPISPNQLPIEFEVEVELSQLVISPRAEEI